MPHRDSEKVFILFQNNKNNGWRENVRKRFKMVSKTDSCYDNSLYPAGGYTGQLFSGSRSGIGSTIQLLPGAVGLLANDVHLVAAVFFNDPVPDRRIKRNLLCEIGIDSGKKCLVFVQQFAGFQHLDSVLL